jgi:hypothetical protein
MQHIARSFRPHSRLKPIKKYLFGVSISYKFLWLLCIRINSEFENTGFDSKSMIWRTRYYYWGHSHVAPS